MFDLDETDVDTIENILLQKRRQATNPCEVNDLRAVLIDSQLMG